MDKTSDIIAGVIGAGTMGKGIAQVLATAGMQVILFDTDSGALSKSQDNLKSTLDRLAEKGKISSEDSQNILNRIQFSGMINSFKNCSLVIEAIVENLDIKQNLFRELENNIDDECILATNTSSLSVTAIASACKKPERVIGIHFFNPAPLMPLVEIIPGLITSNNILKKTRKIISAVGKTTVVAKDTPGFIVNRVARPFYGEALRIFDERWKGLPEGERGMVTIDWAMKEFGGFKMGPFELMDLIGNDINYMVTDTVWRQLFFDPRYKPSLTQKRLFESGRFGKKTGRGYFDYSEGAVILSPEKNVDLGKEIFWRILSMLINEAADALYYNIANRDDIDMAMTKGVNYPMGLLKWCDELGAEKIVERLSSLHSEYSEERYRPSILLKRMAKEKMKFYN